MDVRHTNPGQSSPAVAIGKAAQSGNRKANQE